MLRQEIGLGRSLSTATLAPALTADAEALFDMRRSGLARRAEVAPDRAVVDSWRCGCDVGGILPSLLGQVVTHLGIEPQALAVAAPRRGEAVDHLAAAIFFVRPMTQAVSTVRSASCRVTLNPGVRARNSPA